MASHTTDVGRPSTGGLFITTAVMLALILVVGAWLLYDERGSGPTESVGSAQTTTPLEVTTGQEKGGFAELQDELARVKAATSAPYVIYLVASTEQRQAMMAMGLADGEVALVVGTPVGLAAAQAHIALVQMNAALEDKPRAVRVVDLRPPPVTHATESSLQVAPDAASGQEMHSRWQASRLATGDDSNQVHPTTEMQTVYLIRSPEQATSVRQAIDEANALRDTLGEPPFTAAVLVIGAEAEWVVRALGDADAIRDSFGLPGLTVVDLRTAR